MDEQDHAAFLEYMAAQGSDEEPEPVPTVEECPF
jgi:hypothetical protein